MNARPNADLRIDWEVLESGRYYRTVFHLMHRTKKLVIKVRVRERVLGVVEGLDLTAPYEVRILQIKGCFICPEKLKAADIPRERVEQILEGILDRMVR